MKRYIIISCFLVISLVKAEVVSYVQAARELPEEIIAGQKLVLEFNELGQDTRLIVHASFGKTILKPTIKNSSSSFEIPEFIAEKAGIIQWKLWRDTVIQSGKIRIIPSVEPEVIENYFGPRSIQAGGKDFSMLVSIPTDRFDNPLPDGSRLEISEFFQGNLKRDSLEVGDMFTWKNIYSKKEAGNIIIASTSGGLQSKEMISKVYPSLATGFDLEVQREHPFADGNQVTQIKTSVIKDEFENIVSDGTYVEFLIRDSENTIQKTYATTIDGVATAQLLHPETPDNWMIFANITGMAKSKELAINFKPVIEDFNVKVDLENRMIRVGPLTSFLGQYIPDGAEVVLKVSDEKSQLIHQLSQPSNAGFAIFKLREDINYTDSFTFKIETLGVTKSVD